MKDDKLVPVKYYNTVVRAEVDMEVLKASGISCIYNDDTSAGIYPIFDDKERGIALLVFEHELEQAKEILREYHAATPVENDES